MIFVGSTPTRGTIWEINKIKIYGPYKRKDDRFHIVIVNDDGTKTTKSWPRYLLEQHLGRELLSTEHVDHINNNKTDNRIENLQILSLAENNRKHHRLNPRKIYKFICPYCGSNAEKYLNEVQANRRKGKTGPYCSRACAGKSTYVNPWRKDET